MIVHRPLAHPSRELLSAYASGWIPWAADLCVRTHLETCAQCGQDLAELETAEATFVESLPEAPMAPDALNALLAKLAETAAEPEPVASTTLGDVPLPASLRHVAFRPRRWLRPDLWVAHVDAPRREGWRIYLLHAPAGRKLPGHSHRGPELVCVLTGAFEADERYAAGDFVESPGGSSHTVTVSPEGPCACLIATKGRLATSGAHRLFSTALSV